MGEELSPGSEKMDISDMSDCSLQDYAVTNQVLRLSGPHDSQDIDNEALDNKQYEESSLRLCKTQNATDSHPLMNSPTSFSSAFADLLPETGKHFNFNRVAHSSTLVETHSESQDNSNTINSLPDTPGTPSTMKKVHVYDLPLDISQTELSDNENDKSIYEAHLSSNLENVSLTMNEKEGNLNFLSHGKQSNKLRKIKIVPIDLNIESDISSAESSPNSLKSEDVFTGLRDLDELDIETEPTMSRNDSPEPIEPLSADDERKHARHWQRMVLPDGEHRTIDMRVIEPYKRVLSHGGYLRAGGHTAIVIFSACFLPDKSRCDYDYVMDNLFLYVLWTLERLITEDYVLVYLHGGVSRLPSFSWLKRCYQMVGRKLKKNLSHLYIVHPTFLIKSMLFMAKPFISAKFYRKLSFISSLKELKVQVPIELAAVPEKVKIYDNLHCTL